MRVKMLFPLIFTALIAIPPINCLSHMSGSEDGFLQHIFYEVLESNSEPKEEKTNHIRNEEESPVPVRKSKVVSPTLFDQGPPPYKEYARMARYVVHNSDWCAMATISTRDLIQGSPFANIFSVSDGSNLKEASGIPYFYLTKLEMSVKDLIVNNNASLTMSLAQGRYCTRKHLDPEDPRCAHIILTGQIVKVESGSEEEKFARKALFKRHPDMQGWPEDHGWYFAKLNPVSVIVLDFFGGANEVKVEDYFKATPY